MPLLPPKGPHGRAGVDGPFCRLFKEKVRKSERSPKDNLGKQRLLRHETISTHLNRVVGSGSGRAGWSDVQLWGGRALRPTGGGQPTRPGLRCAFSRILSTYGTRCRGSVLSGLFDLSRCRRQFSLCFRSRRVWLSLLARTLFLPRLGTLWLGRIPPRLAAIVNKRLARTVPTKAKEPEYLPALFCAGS
jgi:hypothetical protein